MIVNIAVGYTVHSTETARECEFLYSIYDRLVETSRHMNVEKSREEQFVFLVKRRKNASDQNISAKERMIYDDFVIESRAGLTDSKLELELHRVSFESIELSPVIALADKAIEKFNAWANDPAQGFFDKFTQLLDFFYTVILFRVEMILLMEGNMKTTAESIRDRCR